MDKKTSDRLSTKKPLPPISKGNVWCSRPPKAGAERRSATLPAREVAGADFPESPYPQAGLSPQVQSLPADKMTMACEEGLNLDFAAPRGHPDRQAESLLGPALSAGLPGASGDCGPLSSGATGMRADVRGARRKIPQQDTAVHIPANMPSSPHIAAALRRIVAEPLRRRPRAPVVAAPSPVPTPAPASASTPVPTPTHATATAPTPALDPPTPTPAPDPVTTPNPSTTPTREVTVADTPTAPAADPAGDSEDDFEMIELPEAGQGTSSGAPGEGGERFPRGLLLDSSSDEEITEWIPESWDGLLGGAVAHLPPTHFFRAWRPNSQGVLKHLLGDIGPEEGAEAAQAEEADSPWGGGGEAEGRAGRAKGAGGNESAASAMEVDRAKGTEGAGDAQSSQGSEDETDAVTSGGDDGRPKFGLLHEVVDFD